MMQIPSDGGSPQSHEIENAPDPPDAGTVADAGDTSKPLHVPSTVSCAAAAPGDRIANPAAPATDTIRHHAAVRITLPSLYSRRPPPRRPPHRTPPAAGPPGRDLRRY